MAVGDSHRFALLDCGDKPLPYHFADYFRQGFVIG
jgi:hypothetical protein